MLMYGTLSGRYHRAPVVEAEHVTRIFGLAMRSVRRRHLGCDRVDLCCSIFVSSVASTRPVGGDREHAVGRADGWLVLGL
jgi:hypothetical protein